MNNYRGYDIRESTGHGKAVKGTKKLSSIKVIKRFQNGIVFVLKYIRYPADNLTKKYEAIEKAKKMVDNIHANRDCRTCGLVRTCLSAGIPLPGEKWSSCWRWIPKGKK